MSSVEEVYTSDVQYSIEKHFEEEGRPPTASDLSPYFGLGKSVMQRELQKVSRKNDHIFPKTLDGKKYWVTDSVVSEDPRYASCQKITDEMIIKTIEDLYEQGEDDCGKGGIYIEKLTDFFGVSRHYLEKRLEELEGQGRVKEVHGLSGFSSPSPRASWLSIDLYKETHDDKEQLSYTDYQNY